MRLDLMTSPEVAAYLESVPGVILPLGSLEQHGPHGLLGTDALAADAVAQEAGRLTGAAVAPPVASGPAQFNLGFAGTVSLRPSTLMALLADVLTSLARGGVSRILLVNGHGGNTAPALAAIQELMGEVSAGRLVLPRPATVKLRAWWEGPRVGRLRQELYGDREGFHVTPSEIALVASLYPGRAVPPAAWPPFVPLPDDPLIERGGDRHEDAARHRARYPDGIVGSAPGLARPEDGRLLLEAAALDVAETWRSFVAAPDQGSR